MITTTLTRKKKGARITTPTLVVDQTKCLANIRRMAMKARQAGIRLRPHCKTHACLEIAQWMRDEGGVECLTVSSLSMAQYFSKEDCWKDITVAFPVNILEIDTINELVASGAIPQLNVVVENTEVVEFLKAHLHNPIGVYMKIDTGYGRTGIPAEDFQRMDPVLDLLKTSQYMTFLGFLTHAGHTYHCRSKDGVKSIHKETTQLLCRLKERYIGDFPNLQLSMGDTPSCSIVESSDLELFDEIRPGNFVFYDLEQASIGSCERSDIAVAVACPIVAKHPERRELVLYGGGVHCSKDRLSGEPEGTLYGRVATKKDTTALSSLEWGDVIEGMYLRSLSQEHGLVVVPETQEFDQFQIGQLLYVLPVHACMTSNALKHNGYLTTDGRQIDRMKN